ncbi:MAG: porin family protein [Bacteroidales bacterium]|nr:porin family protein [Bacteroidales bacterium]
MKKLLMTLILITSVSILSTAQMVIKPGIGLNFTHLSGDPLTREQTGRLGWQIGGTLAFGQEFYLEPGIFWMKNNWDLQELAIDGDRKLKNDISSLRIPVFVGWNVVGSADDDRNFHIFAGPAAMIVTKTNTETTGLTPDDFNKFILGANIGAGLSINKIFIDVGYEWGLNDIYKDDADHVKSRNLWINAGFRLTFL